MFAIILLAFQDLGHRILNVDPGDLQMYKSIIMIPWSLKLLYGLLSDNQKVLKVSRKGWMIAMGAIQFLSLFALFIFKIKSCLFISIFLALTSMSEAFTNVTSQAMMVIQARRDPENGQQDLVTMMYVYTALGGTVGCILGGFMTEKIHPKWCFLMYSFSGLIIMFLGCKLTK